MPLPGPPRGILQRLPSEGSVRHQRVGPRPELEAFVAHFWTVQWDLRGGRAFQAETLPHPCVQLIFERGRASICGVATRRFRRRLQGEGQVFGVKFRPAAFHPFFRAPLSRLTDRVVGLRPVFGRSSRALTAAVFAEPEFQGRIALVESFLKGCLPPMPAATAQLRDLAERLAADSSIVRVDQAASLVALEERTLQRRFRAALGVSPKWVIERYRMHEAAEQLAKPHPPEVASLALQLGYFDQAHFTRAFKSVIGCPPGEYGRKAAAAQAR